jgi:hypothetical protein
MITDPIINLRSVQGYRIIPTRFPSIYLYDRVANQEEFDLLNELEAMTNPRVLDENGNMSLVPESERLFGNGSGPIMSAFTHLNPLGSRFSNGTYGVFYAGFEKETAIAETRFHQEKFMEATAQSPMYLQMRLYTMQIQGAIVDLRSACESEPEILSKSSYSYSQARAAKLRLSGANGILYPSVRNPGGECVAAFKTVILSDCLHAAYLEYHWDGQSINYVTEKIS